MESLVKNALNRTFVQDAASAVQPYQASQSQQAFTGGALPASREQARGYDYQKIKEEFNVDMHQARIIVAGCGGGGSNTVNNLFEMGVRGAKTIVLNTDAGHLSIVKADQKILIGRETTRGLGAGGHAEVGRKAAQESREELKNALAGADMVFVTCGLGGGTGTGSAPVVAEMAKAMGAIVIATVTMPFKLEGTRMHKAEDGLSALRAVADTVIVIENQKLLEYCGDLPLKQAFAVGDQLISVMIKGLTEMITQPSLVNLDYADVKAVMARGGVATIGIGESDSSDRALQAVQRAVTHPLLDVEIDGATGAIVQVIGGEDLRLEEINRIGEYVAEKLNPEANTIWGARIDPSFQGRVQVITIIAGVKSPWILGRTEAPLNSQKGFSMALGIPMIN